MLRSEAGVPPRFRFRVAAFTSCSYLRSQVCIHSMRGIRTVGAHFAQASQSADTNCVWQVFAVQTLQNSETLCRNGAKVGLRICFVHALASLTTFAT